jgi:hypothetical protein
MFFMSASEEAFCAAQTFIMLGINPTVQCRFLLRQLTEAALLPGKGKEKAVEGDGEDPMVF